MDNPNLIEVSLIITKATVQPDGSMRWAAVTSDTSPDNTGEATSLALFQDWVERAESGQTVGWLPTPRKPFLGISHYSDLDGFGEAGITERMHIDGNRFKAGGTFKQDTPLGPALFEAVRADVELARKGDTNQPIRISAAWWDIEHSHGPFIFTRKSLTDICPMCARGEGSKTYLKGQLDHFAATRVPINPRTSLVLEEKSMATTRKQDAASIVSEELAEELEAKSKLTGKSETEGLIIKADGKKKMDDDEAEEDEEMEEGEEEGKKKPKGGSFLASRGALTWDAAKELPEAAGLSRLALLGLIRRSAADLPEPDRLTTLEAALDAVGAEMNEIKAAMEDLYFLQPAVELLGEEETTLMSDYLDTFNQTVTEALDSDQPAAQKAQVIQKALNDVALSLKAELEPKPEPGDVAAAIKAALSPLADQLAQLNARLGATQAPVVTVPTQKSVTVPTVAQNPAQPQLPVSPITGQPSSLTEMVRRSVGIY